MADSHHDDDDKGGELAAIVHDDMLGYSGDGRYSEVAGKPIRI